MTRGETDEERDDRRWDDVLQELRIMQTGVQITAGFLLTLPLQQAFTSLADWQRDLYLVLMMTAAVAVALVLAPVAIHVRLSGDHVKGRVVEAGRRLLVAIEAAISVLVVGATVFETSIVAGTHTAVTLGVVAGVVLAALLLALPSLLLPRDRESRPRQVKE